MRPTSQKEYSDTVTLFMNALLSEPAIYLPQFPGAKITDPMIIDKVLLLCKIGFDPRKYSRATCQDYPSKMNMLRPELKQEHIWQEN